MGSLKYEIMHKDESVGAANFRDDGLMADFVPGPNKDLIPLWDKTASDNLRKWWQYRSIPLNQGQVAKMLFQKGLGTRDEFLLRNLGLSLTDCYWIRPADIPLTWKDVNLFTNDFKENLLYYEFDKQSPEEYPYHPNSSLQGNLEKTWAIFGGNRVLIKGNHSNLSSESINETFACMIHERQGFENHTHYYLLSIPEKPYDFGCVSKAFTSEKLELVPMYAVVTEEKKPNDISVYEFFIRQCGKHGMNMDEVRHFLEYETLVDFVISGRDRHLNNIAVLRDSDTLQFKQMAPIFDSGKSLFVDDRVPSSDKELLSIETTSFASTELKLLKTVQDRNAIDLTQLPSRKELKAAYLRDTQIDESRIEKICDGYERKTELCRLYQMGQNLSSLVNDRRFFRSAAVREEKREEERDRLARAEINIAEIEQAEHIDIDPLDLRASGPRRDPGEKFVQQDQNKDLGLSARVRQPEM